jgi:hypothetical protein
MDIDPMVEVLLQLLIEGFLQERESYQPLLLLHCIQANNDLPGASTK